MTYALRLVLLFVVGAGLVGSLSDRPAWAAGEPPRERATVTSGELPKPRPMAARVAFLRGGDLYVLDAAQTQEVRLTDDGSVSDPWWAADGQTLFIRRSAPGTPAGIWRWQPNTGLQPAGGNDISDDWAPTGAAVAVMEPPTGRWQPDPGWMETRVWMERHGERWPLTPAEPGVRWEPLAWSPDGRRLALLRLSFGQSQIVKGTRVPLTSASLWVTDGDLRAPTLRELPLPTSFQGSPGVPDVADWSPDGRFLTLGMGPAGPCNSCRADGTLWQVVPVDGGPPVELGSGLTVIRSVAWAPDGSFVVLSAPAGRETYRRKQLLRVDPLTGARIDLSRDSAWADIEPAVSPDGGTIAFVRGQAVAGQPPTGGAQENRAAMQSRRIWAMDADGSNLRQVTDAPGWTDEAPVWTPDGRWLVFVRWRPAGDDGPAMAQLWAMRPDGTDARVLVPELDLPPDLGRSFGYYGALRWQERFAVAPALAAAASADAADGLPAVGTGLVADRRPGPWMYAGVGLLTILGGIGVSLVRAARGCPPKRCAGHLGGEQ